MEAVIFGATGMVGIEVLDQCLAARQISRVVTLGRNTTGLEHEKLQEIEHSDFLDFSAQEHTLATADLCFYCLGVYQTRVSRQKFWQVTVDYLDALIATLEAVNKGITFCLFSTQGAAPKENSPFLFGNVKGRAEKHLGDSALHNQYIFRPGYISPGRKTAISGPGMWLCKPIYKLFPFLGINAVDLAAAMVDVGLNGHANTVLGNGDLRAIAQRLKRQG